MAALIQVLAWVWRWLHQTDGKISTSATEVLEDEQQPTVLFRRYPANAAAWPMPKQFDALSAEEKLGLVQIGDNEALRDRWFLDKGLTYMQAHPWLILVNKILKIGAAFGLLPSPRRGLWPNLIHACSYGPVMLLGCVGYVAASQRLAG